MPCFGNPSRHQKASTKNFPVIKKVSLPKSTGKLLGWFVFLLTLEKITSAGHNRKKHEIIKAIIIGPG